MAILIVDDETKTREALRTLLVLLGHKVILEAKNGEEALRVAESEKSRIRMIVADLEMPYMDGLTLASKVRERSYLDLTAFLLITSDKSQIKQEYLETGVPILDSYLVKPFRKAGLSQAMSQAYTKRCSTRKTILFLGSEVPKPLLDLLQSPQQFHLRDLVQIRRPSELVESVASIHELGALFISSTDFKDLTKDPQDEIKKLLSNFKKTQIGIITPVVCLYGQFRETIHFGSYSQFFLQSAAPSREWSSLMQKMEARVSSSWEMEILFEEVRPLLQKKDFKSASKVVDKMLKLDLNHPGIHSMAGDIFEQQSKTEEAILSFQKAIDLNPSLLHPYIKVINLASNADLSTATKYASLAVEYFPNNLDLLLMSSRVFLQAGDLSQTKRILDYILKNQPDHPGAKLLLQSIPC